MASEFLKSIQNYFDTVHNYKNFVGFKSRSNRTTATAADTRYDSWAVNGDDPSGDGSPILNADGEMVLGTDGKSIGNDIKKANSFTQRWGDNESYQVGNNYTELEGDAVTVAVGNSSTRRKGWTNNVTDGLTFNTQIGGTVATSLFAVTTMLGFRCNTFVGAEVAINVAVAAKVSRGESYSFFKAAECGLSKEETKALLKRTEIVEDVKSLIGEFNSIVVSTDMIVATDHSLTCMKSSVNAVDYNVSAVIAEIDSEFSTTISSRGVTVVKGGMLSLQSNASTTVEGLLIKIG
jgi:hypothetical protein